MMLVRTTCAGEVLMARRSNSSGAFAEVLVATGLSLSSGAGVWSGWFHGVEGQVTGSYGAGAAVAKCWSGSWVSFSLSS